MTQRFARRVAKRRAICENLGLKPLSEGRAQEIFESHAARRDDAIFTARARFADCRSVTATAKMLGMRRAVLFEWLQDAGLLYRDADGVWRATRKAIERGWLVQRGPESISWAQITRGGWAELERRIGHRADD
jgi:hypothetical protein